MCLINVRKNLRRFRKEKKVLKYCHQANSIRDAQFNWNVSIKLEYLTEQFNNIVIFVWYFD